MEVGEEGGCYTYRYTVTTRMIPALRWAVMRAEKRFPCCMFFTWCRLGQGQSSSNIDETPHHPLINPPPPFQAVDSVMSFQYTVVQSPPDQHKTGHRRLTYLSFLRPFWRTHLHTRSIQLRAGDDHECARIPQLSSAAILVDNGVIFQSDVISAQPHERL